MKGPALPVEKKEKKNFGGKIIRFFSLKHPSGTLSVHKKIQSIQSGRLAGYW